MFDKGLMFDKGFMIDKGLMLDQGLMFDKGVMSDKGLIYLFIYLNIVILGVPITRGILTWCPDTGYK